jgi:hypothetical protein
MPDLKTQNMNFKTRIYNLKTQNNNLETQIDVFKVPQNEDLKTQNGNRKVPLR